MEKSQEAEEQGEFCILFLAGGLYFLVPLAQLEKVVFLSDAGELPILDFGKLIGAESEAAPAGNILILHGQDGDFGIEAETVIGMRRVTPLEKIPLGVMARSVENSYLDGVVYIEELKPSLVYLINAERLWLRIEDHEEGTK